MLASVASGMLAIDGSRYHESHSHGLSEDRTDYSARGVEVRLCRVARAWFPHIDPFRVDRLVPLDRKQGAPELRADHFGVRGPPSESLGWGSRLQVTARRGPGAPIEVPRCSGRFFLCSRDTDLQLRRAQIDFVGLPQRNVRVLQRPKRRACKLAASMQESIGSARS